jgi:preprotein translocase subunit SecY
MNEKQKVNTQDRRRYFRIDDEVNLFYKKVEEQHEIGSSYFSTNVLGACSLTAAMEMFSQESQLIINRLERNEPDIAEYLQVMENKIDLIAQAVVMQGTDFAEQGVRNINLSAAGLAFDCEEKLEEGQYLEIKMLLTSCMAVIATIAKVVNCKENAQENSQYPFYVGVDYIRMKDQDRELLIKHVVKKQMQQIREKKEQ